MMYVWEHKSTSEDIGLGSVYWRRLTLDPQISLYVEGAKSLGFDCRGVLYDVLRKPQHKPMVSKNETAEAYGKRVLEAIAEQPEKYYQRGTVVRLEDDEREARLDVWQTAGEIREAKRLAIYPRNPDSCIQWSRPCDYFDVCSGIASIDDPMLFKASDVEHEELDEREAAKGLLTQSSLRCFRACARRYKYRYVMRVRPLAPKAETLRMGTSIHASLEVWMKTGGDVDAALNALDSKTDPFVRAKESAIICGYHARWEKPVGVIAVEREFKFPLVNPETGAASRTFELAGKFDAVCEVSE